MKKNKFNKLNHNIIQQLADSIATDIYLRKNINNESLYKLTDSIINNVSKKILKEYSHFFSEFTEDSNLITNIAVLSNALRKNIFWIRKVKSNNNDVFDCLKNALEALENNTSSSDIKIEECYFEYEEEGLFSKTFSFLADKAQKLGIPIAYDKETKKIKEGSEIIVEDSVLTEGLKDIVDLCRGDSKIYSTLYISSSNLPLFTKLAEGILKSYFKIVKDNLSVDYKDSWQPAENFPSISREFEESFKSKDSKGESPSVSLKNILCIKDSSAQEDKNLRVINKRTNTEPNSSNVSLEDDSTKRQLFTEVRSAFQDRINRYVPRINIIANCFDVDWEKKIKDPSSTNDRSL